MWQQWVNFIAGLWLILSGFLNFSPAAMTTNFFVVGIIVAILGLWGALQYRSTDSRYQQQHSH